MKPLRSCVRHYEELRERLDREDRRRSVAGATLLSIVLLRKALRLVHKRKWIEAFDKVEAYCPRHYVRLEPIGDRPRPTLWCARCELDKSKVLWRQS